ncbi:YdcF family protein [Pseudemcibacter aquimaris]|uniref:YdcF family protein n=1 Tax=Pseudemcibacter aquimaris TaxID=2857064 RepID=UPI0020132947|nr:YdcF family protein [Pseudemcibacter aquimaris]MCC3861616.1 YdcF family protein [Pseudemcibacter aquimaris]WDU58385.1 YdcF family protein [Pseudemcibacter aquimaris]
MRSILAFILIAFLMWLGGYVWFINKLSNNMTNLEERSDAIVVLTGGKNRLDVAGKLLEEKMGDKLYVSGVDSKVTRTELIALLGTSQEMSDCCVEIGKQAVDTVGNALETLTWVGEHDIESIRVVTSLEHMPRAMVEFRRFMPDVKLIEHPVGSWRPENINYFNLSQEYSKYIISLLRSRISSEIYT